METTSLLWNMADRDSKDIALHWVAKLIRDYIIFHNALAFLQGSADEISDASPRFLCSHFSFRFTKLTAGGVSVAHLRFWSPYATFFLVLHNDNLETRRTDDYISPQRGHNITLNKLRDGLDPRRAHKGSVLKL